MSQTITEEITPDQVPTLIIRTPARLRDAFLQLSLYFENSSLPGVTILSDVLRASDLTQTERRLIIKMVKSGELFSHIRDLGSRVGTFTVNPTTSSVTGSDVAESARRNVITLRSSWDALLNDVRASEWLREQADMPDGAFTYRTLSGARFPRKLTHNEMLSVRSSNKTGEYNLYTEFTKWSGKENMYDYSDPGNGDYSTSAKDSGFVYEPKTFKIDVQSQDIPVSGHARQRLIDYGYNDSSLTLESTIVNATISSGRTVPNKSMEETMPRLPNCSYKLTLEVQQANILLSTGETINTKLVISCYAEPKLQGRAVTIADYMAESSSPLKVHNVMFVTVIFLETTLPTHMLRCTGMPVIPSHVEMQNKPNAVAGITSSKDIRDASNLISSFNDNLSNTDQWLNIKHAAIMEYCSQREFTKKAFASNKYAHITECGVEFADVELIQKRHPLLFSKLERIGYEILIVQMRNNGYAKSISIDQMRDDFANFFDMFGGPSIVHSEEIRSPNSDLSGTKHVNSSLLITRLVLSLLLVVGVGDVGTHNPLNSKTLPMSHHLLNQKRAEAMLIPLSVMKDQLLVYSLSGSVGRLLKSVKKSHLITSGLYEIMKRSFDPAEGLNILEYASSQAIFAITAPVIQVSSDSERRAISLVSPSGFEYDVSPIIEEICSKLRGQMIRLIKPRAVIAWHPLFCVVISITPEKNRNAKFHAIIMPAKRKSSIATSYHNGGDSLRSNDFSDDIRIHYGVLREEKGFLSALRTYTSIYAR